MKNKSKYSVNTTIVNKHYKTMSVSSHSPKYEQSKICINVYFMHKAYTIHMRDYSCDIGMNQRTCDLSA